jgi:hypothetical protein
MRHALFKCKTFGIAMNASGGRKAKHRMKRTVYLFVELNIYLLETYALSTSLTKCIDAIKVL